MAHRETGVICHTLCLTEAHVRLRPGTLANTKEAKPESEGLSLGRLLEFRFLLIWRGTQVWAVGDDLRLVPKPVVFAPQTQGPRSDQFQPGSCSMRVSSNPPRLPSSLEEQRHPCRGHGHVSMKADGVMRPAGAASSQQEAEAGRTFARAAGGDTGPFDFSIVSTPGVETDDTSKPQTGRGEAGGLEHRD